MTDKQIIIDGVDVSGCKYYLFREQQPNGERCCGMGLVDCNGNDCLYKKYKRKEQECERLKHDNGYEVGALEKTIDNLKAENDELKRENELAKQLINWILKFFELTDYDWQYDQNEISFLIEDCMDDKQSTIDFVTDINKELLAKLTEIKEIAEHCINQDICTFCDNSDKCYIEDEEIPTYDVCKLILQKISEVEDGN